MTPDLISWTLVSLVQENSWPRHADEMKSGTHTLKELGDSSFMSELDFGKKKNA